jgi:hypothetical protein
VRTTSTGWHGDIDRGGEVAVSNRPGGDNRALKARGAGESIGTWRRRAQRPLIGGPGRK